MAVFGAQVMSFMAEIATITLKVYKSSSVCQYSPTHFNALIKIFVESTSSIPRLDVPSKITFHSSQSRHRQYFKGHPQADAIWFIR